jgi:hypothetical protein
LPDRRTSLGPDDSQNAIPNRRPGTAPASAILDRLDEVRLAEDQVEFLGLLDPYQVKLELVGALCHGDEAPQLRAISRRNSAISRLFSTSAGSSSPAISLFSTARSGTSVPAPINDSSAERLTKPR